MPPGMKFHTNVVNRVPAPRYRPPAVDPREMEQAAKANELLNLRSKNISHIMAQRVGVNGFESHAAVQPPAANPRVGELHQELGIDKVVLVKSPFKIDTTPNGYYNAQLSQNMDNGGQGKLRDSWMPGARQAVSSHAPPRVDAVEYSANGQTAPAYVNGRLLRGGWAVN